MARQGWRNKGGLVLVGDGDIGNIDNNDNINNGKRPLVFVITGESDAGGVGRNVNAMPEEMATGSSVRIMNLTDGKFALETMFFQNAHKAETKGFAKNGGCSVDLVRVFEMLVRGSHDIS